MVVRSPCIPSVKTVPHGHRIVYSTSQHSTTWQLDRAFHQSTRCHMVVRSSCISSVNTVPHGGQIVHSTNQHSVTWRSDRALHQSTVSQGDQTVHCTNQHSITRRSDGKLVRMGWWDGGGGWNSEPLRQFCSLFTYFRLSWTGIQAHEKLIKRNAEFKRTTQNLCTFSRPSPPLSPTSAYFFYFFIFQAADRQIVDDEWKLSAYPLSVTSAGVSGVCWRMLARVNCFR